MAQSPVSELVSRLKLTGRLTLFFSTAQQSRRTHEDKLLHGTLKVLRQFLSFYDS